MRPRRLLLPLVALVVLAGSGPLRAAPIPNTLWIGNDTNSNLPILNTTTTGVVLQTIPNTVGVGFGVNLATNTLYVNTNFTQSTPYSLFTLAPSGAPVNLPGGISSEDFSFDGTNLLVGDFSGQRIVRMDPTTGAQVSAVPVPFNPLGLTWDGRTGFWATGFDTSGRVYHYDAAGNLLSSFVAFQGFAGGLGYDTRDGTLWVGGANGSVSHFTQAGVFLDSFNTGDGRFVDGLEFEGAAAVPEPATVALLGGMLFAGGLSLVRRRRTAVA